MSKFEVDDGLRKFFLPLKGNLLVLVASMIIWTFISQMIQTYESIYILALGGSGVVLGILSAIHTSLGTFFMIPGGYLADTHSRCKLVGLVTIFASFGYFFYAIAVNWTWLIFASILLSLTYFIDPALQAIKADSVKPEERGRGYMLLNTLPQIPAIFAPTIGGILILDEASKYGIGLNNVKVIYLLLFLSIAFAGLIRLFFLKETVSFGHRMANDKIGYNVFKEAYSTITNSTSSIKRLIILSGFFMFCFHFEYSFRAIYAIGIKGLTAVEWGLIVSASQIISIISAFAIGWLIDSYGRKKVFIPSITFLAFASYLLIISNTFLSFLISMAIIATCEQSRMMALQVLIADSTPRLLRGRVFSIISILNNLGSSTSTLLSGLLYDIAPTIPFYSATLMYLFATLLALKFLREAEKKHI